MSYRRSSGMSNLADKLISVKDKGSVLNESQYKKASENGFGNLKKSIDEITEPIVRDFIDRGAGLNEAIAKVADTEKLNDDEINRVIQTTNMKIYQILYGNTVGKDCREVKFDIASPQKVLSILGRSGTKTEPAESMAIESDEKTAGDKSKKSIEDMIIDYVPAERFTSYSKPIADFRRESLLDKIANEINKNVDEFNRLTKESKESIDMIGVALSKYASRKVPYQEVFNRMCVRSGMRKKDQIMVKEAFDRFKGNYKVASDVSLELFDIDSYEDFSLGRFSISKQADENIMTLPEVTNSKQTIKDFTKLVDLAVKIQQDQKALEALTEGIKEQQEIVNKYEQ